MSWITSFVQMNALLEGLSCEYDIAAESPQWATDTQPEREQAENRR